MTRFAHARFKACPLHWMEATWGQELAEVDQKAWVFTTKTYQNPNLLVVGKIPDCLVFLSARHASRIIQKVNVLVLGHSTNDTGNEDEGGRDYLAVSGRSWVPFIWFPSHQ